LDQTVDVLILILLSQGIVVFIDGLLL